MNGISVSTSPLHFLCSSKHTFTPLCNAIKINNLSLQEIPPNALLRKQDSSWRGGFSLGVDLGLSRTGLALSKGYSIRPLKVLELRGQKLELQLLHIAEKEEVDEFIIGLPISSDGKETTQSNIVRSIAGRFAVRAAERGWRVYLQDENGTSADAMDLMIDIVDGYHKNPFMNIYVPNYLHQIKEKLNLTLGRKWRLSSSQDGLSKTARQDSIDAYAAMMVLERYFSQSGEGIELVLPKQLELQEKLRKGPPLDSDFFPEDDLQMCNT